VTPDNRPHDKLDRVVIFLGLRGRERHSGERVGAQVFRAASFHRRHASRARGARHFAGPARAADYGRGELVPDSIVLRMVAERIERPDCSHGFVFDGFPRTVAQAQWLGELLKQHGFKPRWLCTW